MPPFAAVYERFALAMHDRVLRDAAAEVAKIMGDMTPDTTWAAYLRVHAVNVTARSRFVKALADFVGMHEMGMLDDMDIDSESGSETDTDDTASS